MFSYEIWKIKKFKKTYFEEHLRRTGEHLPNKSTFTEENRSIVIWRFYFEEISKIREIWASFNFPTTY